jgi:dipeptidyl aminopeptidase/acylaminoacyl peptidase
MNRHDDLDRMLSAWLDDPLTLPAPRYLDEVLARTRRTRQRPAWASLERWLPMTVTLRNPALPMPARLFALGLALLLGLLIALASLPFLAGVMQSPSPDGATTNGLIAFDRDGDIYVVDTPEGEPRLLVGGPEEDVGPLWSPDGRHLLFARITEEGEFPMLTDEHGTMPVALVDEPFVGVNWVDWAPDSSALVVSSELERIDEPGAIAPTVSIVPADGSGDVQHLTMQPGPGADLPAWRPGTDGTIELLYRRRGDPSELHYSQIRDDGVSGGVVLRVEDIEGKRDDRNQGLYDFDGAIWSPDGERFIYQTLHDLESWPNDPGMRVHVASFDDGTDPAGRDDTMLEFDQQSNDELFPAWSPDGSRVAFVSYDAGMARLVIMPVPHGASAPAVAEAVATAPIANWDPLNLTFDWAPDGSALIIVDHYKRSEGVPSVHLVDADTAAMTAVDWKADGWPSWQAAPA